MTGSRGAISSLHLWSSEYLPSSIPKTRTRQMGDFAGIWGALFSNPTPHWDVESCFSIPFQGFTWSQAAHLLDYQENCYIASQMAETWIHWEALCTGCPAFYVLLSVFLAVGLWHHICLFASTDCALILASVQTPIHFTRLMIRKRGTIQPSSQLCAA